MRAAYRQLLDGTCLLLRDIVFMQHSYNETAPARALPRYQAHPVSETVTVFYKKTGSLVSERVFSNSPVAEKPG
jgi:hypothetical protein